MSLPPPGEGRFDYRPRFFAKIIEQDSGCHLWTAAKTGDGYGAFVISRKVYGAHRVAWVIAGGELSPGLVIDHLCRNRACVNPAHLELVSEKVNINRGNSVQAIKAAAANRTHCRSKRHEIESPGQAYCRPCKNEAQRIRRERLRAGK